MSIFRKSILIAIGAVATGLVAAVVVLSVHKPAPNDQGAIIEHAVLILLCLFGLGYLGLFALVVRYWGNQLVRWIGILVLVAPLVLLPFALGPR